jgi:hypothetical protein
MPTQNMNFTTSGTIAYTGPNLTWIVNAGVTGEVQGSPVVETNQPGSRLENHGTLISHSSTTVLIHELFGLAPEGFLLLNVVGGSIVSDGQAAYSSFGFDGATVDNRGSMSGTTLGVKFGQSTNVTLLNSGSIFGQQAGVLVEATDGVSVVNSGAISSDQYGLRVTGGLGFRAEVENSGGLRGDVAAVLVENGDRLLLTNTGTVVGDIVCNSAGQKDKIVNSGDVVGDVFLGQGNDLYNGAGGRVGAVYGGEGNDRIIGGPTSETFSGGPGKDDFVFSAPLNALGNVDIITDLNPQKDTIAFDKAIFKKLKKTGVLSDQFFAIGDEAKDKKDYVLYDKKTGFAAYDSDGSKKGAEPIVFAKLEDHLKLKADDLLVT